MGVQEKRPVAHGDLLFVDQVNNVVEEATRLNGLFVVAENGNQGPRGALPPSQSSTGRARSYRTPTVSPVIADNGISAVAKVPF